MYELFWAHILLIRLGIRSDPICSQEAV